MNSRRLPHIYPERKWLFVTWCLHGSIPAGVYPPAGKAAGEAFVWTDRYLDRARTGPLFLKQGRIAKVVLNSLFTGVRLEHYQLEAFVIMPNHVHVLLFPLIAPARLLKSLKGFTAREANKILGRIGQPFWQAESYDHFVRDEQEFRRISAYIENNPVRAGLVVHPDEYAFSSARVGMSADTAGRSACATGIDNPAI